MRPSLLTRAAVVLALTVALTVTPGTARTASTPAPAPTITAGAASHDGPAGEVARDPDRDGDHDETTADHSTAVGERAGREPAAPVDPELRDAIARRQQERYAIRQDRVAERRERREAIQAAASGHGSLHCQVALPWCELARDRLGSAAPGWPSLGWDIHLASDRPADAPAGGARPAWRRIDIYPQDDWTDEGFTWLLMHELGHAVDHATFDDTDRDRWRAERGIPDRAPWRAASWPHDYSAGAEDLAEVIAWLLTGQLDDQQPRSPYGIPDEAFTARWRDTLMPPSIVSVD